MLKARSGSRGVHAYRPRVFFSLISYTGIRRTQEGVFESSLWKLDRPPLGLLAFPKQFLHGGCEPGRLPKFSLTGAFFALPRLWQY